jgi:hypothetical protein
MAAGTVPAMPYYEQFADLAPLLTYPVAAYYCQRLFRPVALAYVPAGHLIILERILAIVEQAGCGSIAG